MEQFISIVHVLAAFAIIALILLQQGKGADMGASFGAGASQTLFGSSGSGNALTKSTAILVTVFFATSFGLSMVAKHKAGEAGDVNIPKPAVVETKVKTKTAPKPAGDIPSGNVSKGDVSKPGVSKPVPAVGKGAGAAASQPKSSGESDIPESGTAKEKGKTAAKDKGKQPDSDIPQ